MEFKKIMEAEEKGLIQLYLWVSAKEIPWLLKEYNRIKQNFERRVMLVEFKNKYSIFVDDLVNKRVGKEKNLERKSI